MNKYVGSIVQSLLILFALLSTSAHAADTYPNRPITIVVPTPVGGGSDTIARIFADFLQRRLGQAVVIENKPGASGAIGASLVSRARADGYTLLFNGSEFSSLPAVRKNPNYNYENFTYLVKCFSIHPLLIGSPKFPAKSASELIDYMKANPGKATYGSTGTGGVIHLAIALFENSLNVSGLHVPFMGQSPNYSALLGGHVDFSQGTFPLPDGINVLASVGTNRNPAYPGSPTLEELGIEGATWDIWYGFLAPPNLPAEISEKLNSAIVQVLQDPIAIEKFRTLLGGAKPNVLVGNEFKTSVVTEHKRWKALAEKYHIEIE